jgi:predicted dehydrogenase
MSKIRLVILGSGGMEAEHAERFMKNLDVAIVALGDVPTTVMERFKADTGLDAIEPIPELFTDAAPMFAEAELDAVITITPHTLHFDHAMLATDAGLHVFMGKPMVTSSKQAHALAQRFGGLGTVFILGYNTPCTPDFDFLRESVRNQTTGKLELISGYLSQDWMKLTAGTWRQQPEFSGGGQAYDSGALSLNSRCWSVESDIAEVFTFLDNRGTPVDINSSINLQFTNGVMASGVVSGNGATNGVDLPCMFEHGRIDIDGGEGKWIKVWQGDERVKNPAISGEPQTLNDNFIDAILGRAEPRTSIQNGIVQSELMDAIYESAKTGPPAKPTAKG